MDLNENLTQYLKLLGKEILKRERFWYRERFGFKLQFKAKRSYTTDRASYKSYLHLDKVLRETVYT